MLGGFIYDVDDNKMVMMMIMIIMTLAVISSVEFAMITVDICLQLPEDPIVFSLISREEAQPQFSTGRVSQASFATARCVSSVWPPTPPCCRAG